MRLYWVTFPPPILFFSYKTRITFPINPMELQWKPIKKALGMCCQLVVNRPTVDAFQRSVVCMYCMGLHESPNLTSFPNNLIAPFFVPFFLSNSIAGEFILVFSKSLCGACYGRSKHVSHGFLKILIAQVQEPSHVKEIQRAEQVMWFLHRKVHLCNYSWPLNMGLNWVGSLISESFSINI